MVARWLSHGTGLYQTIKQTEVNLQLALVWMLTEILIQIIATPGPDLSLSEKPTFLAKNYRAVRVSPDITAATVERVTHATHTSLIANLRTRWTNSVGNTI
jgi:hypothetical protein